MRLNRKTLFWLTGTFWLLSAGVVFSETVVLQLKNGDRLSGTVISETTNEVVLTNLWIKSLSVPLSQIEKRETLPAPATATNEPVQVVATNAPAKSIATNASPVSALPPIKPKGPKRWSFDLQVGVNLQYNQKSYQLYYGAFKANYAGERIRDIFDYKFNYGRTDGILSANNMNGSWRIEYDITKNKRAFLFNALGAGYDEIRKVDFTYDESFGVGYKLVERTNFVFTVDSGVNYQQEFFSKSVTPPSKDYFSLRLAETVSWKINSRVTVDEKAEFYPRLTSWTDYRARAELNLSYKLNPAGSLFLNLSLIDAYDTQPAAGVSANDLQIRSSLGWKF